jgi:tetratricopeptide (TPR) repeat protein
MSRFRIEENDADPDFDDSYYEPVSRPRRKANLGIKWLYTFLGLFVVGLIATGVWWQFFRTPPQSGPIPKDNYLSDKRSLDQVLDNAYLPSQIVSPELAKCIDYYKNGYIKQAFLACEEFLNTTASDKEKSIAITVIGVMLDEAGRYPSAVEKLKTAIDYDPKNFHAFYNLAIVYKHMGNLEEARKIIKEAKKIAPQDPRISLLAGNLFHDLGDDESAIEAYKDGMESQKDSATLAYNTALVYMKQGKMLEAKEFFDRAIKEAPSSQIAFLSHGHLGSIFYNNENFEASEFHFRAALKLKPTDSKYLYNLGLLEQRKGKNEEAVDLFQKALETGSMDTALYRSLAESFQTLNLPLLAIRSLQKAVLINPKDLDSHFQLADIFYKRGDLGDAENLFRKIIQMTPGDSYTETAYLNLGIVLDEMARYDDSLKAFDAAIKLNPKNDRAYYNKGIAAKHSGRAAVALESWKKAVILNPDNNIARESIGDSMYENGFHRQAVDEYKIIIARKPESYKIRIKLAQALQKLGQSKDAENEYKEVLNKSTDADDIKISHKKLALLYNSSKEEKQTSKAKEEAFRATHMDPTDMDSRLVLSKILMDSGSSSDREKAIEELLVISRSEASPSLIAKAYNYLGICYYQNGEYKRSMVEFQNALDLDPNLAEAYENKRASRAAYEKELSKKTGVRY